MTKNVIQYGQVKYHNTRILIQRKTYCQKRVYIKSSCKNSLKKKKKKKKKKGFASFQENVTAKMNLILPSVQSKLLEFNKMRKFRKKKLRSYLCQGFR